MLIFDRFKLSFYISTALWLRKYDGFDFSRDQTIEVSRDFLGGAPSFWFSTLPSSGERRPCESGDKTFRLNTWPRDRRDFVGEVLSSWVTTQLSLGSIGLVKVEVQRFLFVTWPRTWCVTWLRRWGPLILSHHPAKFEVHRPCQSEDITFFVCHVTSILKCHVTLWVGSLYPKSPPY